MAKCTVTLPDGMIAEIEALQRATNDILQEAVVAGGNVAVEAVRTELAAVIGQGTAFDSRTTGELFNSLGASPVDTSNKGDVNVHIGFNEPRRIQYAQNTKRKGRKTRSGSGDRSYYTITNAMIANVLEHGKRSANQDPTKFLERARRKSAAAVRAAMLEVLERRMKP